MKPLLTVSTLAVALLGGGFAHAKAPELGDLVATLTLPAVVQPGEPIAVSAAIDVAAYCARTTIFTGPTCLTDAAPGAAADLVLLTEPEGDGAERVVAIRGRLERGADGVYRGQMTTLPCQKAGVYRGFSLEPNPALDRATTRIETTPTCAADRAAPEIARVRVPARLPLPTTTPADARGWTHGRLLVEVTDDASGAAAITYELATAGDATGSLGGASVPCQPCGAAWTCTAEIPLCGFESGDFAVRVRSVQDRAGRARSFSAQAAPQAIVRCGADSAPAPELACALALPDAGADRPDAAVATTDAAAAPAGGPDARTSSVEPPAEMAGGTRASDAAASAATAPTSAAPRSGGCSVGASPTSSAGGALLVVAALMLRTRRRQRARR